MPEAPGDLRGITKGGDDVGSAFVFETVTKLRGHTAAMIATNPP